MLLLASHTNPGKTCSTFTGKITGFNTSRILENCGSVGIDIGQTLIE
jgi:hypothetical protein